MMIMKQEKKSEQQMQVDHENMSNLTSEATSVSESNHQSSTPNPSTRKRSMPRNPDQEAEVIALSPNTLLATNRFVCEICNKGFQRDQNLQLHRRGHNLPWKLKRRNSKEVQRKKVYICPEVSCPHHEPCRALGDLTGIKKHFSRKHGEKKWKCDKCSKKYAVQSDCKAHSKVCGTREYRCDCGTLFSRRDSFITHRAFCDAMAEENARAITENNNNIILANHMFRNASLHQQQSPLDQTIMQTQFPVNHLPQWLMFNQDLSSPNPSASPHLSATALLQRAAEMGATMSYKPSQMAASACSEQDLGSHGLSEIMSIGFDDSFGVIMGSKSEGRGEINNGELTRDFLGLQRAFFSS